MEVEGVPLVLPEFVEELRPHQTQAMIEITRLFETRDVVFLDAPTGAGKTIIGEGVRQIARAAPHGQISQALYLCTTKSLQVQFLHDFPYSKLIKGRANYTTFDEPDLFDDKTHRHLDASHCSKRRFKSDDVPLCGQCEWVDADLKMGDNPTNEVINIQHCHFCHPWQYCPYEVAKQDALHAPLAVANTHYLLTEANYVGRFGLQPKGGPKFPLMVIDEADTLESVLMGFVEVSFAARYLREYKIGTPKYITKPDTWLTWAEQAKEKLTKLAEAAGLKVSGYHDDPPPLNEKKRAERLSRHLATVTYVEKALRTEPDNWVYDNAGGGVTLKPVTVSSHAGRLLWKHSTKFLLMSASVISPDQMAQELGLGPEEWGSVIVDSNFPPERRPIYVRPRANMTAKTKEAEWPKMVRAVNEILDGHPGESVLVHTVSYPWNRALYNGLKGGDHGHRLLTYESSDEKEATLEDFKHRPGAVLLGPSLDRGVDLKDDLCRVIIITKVPYPNLGDEQTKKRFFGTGAAGRSWYTTQTIRSIVQMTGRAMRHKEDSCISYILDAQFKSNLWSNAMGRNRFPRWWTDALHFEAPRRR